MFLFLLFLTFHSSSSFFPVPLFYLLNYLFYLFSPFLWETTQNDPPVKTGHNQPGLSVPILSVNTVSSVYYRWHNKEVSDYLSRWIGLALRVLRKAVADNSLIFFFYYYFPNTIRLGISCELSAFTRQFTWNAKSYFLWKKTKTKKKNKKKKNKQTNR